MPSRRPKRVPSSPHVAPPDLEARVRHLEGSYEHLPTSADLRESRSGSWTRFVAAVDKPLGFYVFALVIVEGFLSTVLVFSGLDQGTKTHGVWAIIGLFVLVVGIVTALVWFKPTALVFTGYEALWAWGKFPTVLRRER